jgi:hypothetical protein
MNNISAKKKTMSNFDFSYRTREEVQDVRKSRDPITSFRDKLVQAKLATEEEFKVYVLFFSKYNFVSFLSFFNRILTMK